MPGESELGAPLGGPTSRPDRMKPLTQLQTRIVHVFSLRFAGGSSNCVDLSISEGQRSWPGGTKKILSIGDCSLQECLDSLSFLQIVFLEVASSKVRVAREAVSRSPYTPIPNGDKSITKSGTLSPRGKPP